MITVSGKAEVLVAPDGAVITVAAHSYAPDLSAARSDNDGRVKRMLAALQALGIAARDIQTEYISISVVQNEEREGDHRIVGYSASNTVVVQVHDLTKVQPILSALFAAGANELSNVGFSTTKDREYHDEARGLALTAAKEKAQAMAARLGMQIGLPWTIVEVSDELNSALRLSRNVASSHEAPPVDRVQGVVVPGSITITAEVHVSFELTR